MSVRREKVLETKRRHYWIFPNLWPDPVLGDGLSAAGWRVALDLAPAAASRTFSEA